MSKGGQLKCGVISRWQIEDLRKTRIRENQNKRPSLHDGPPIEPVPPPYGTPICRHPLEPLNQSDSRHPAIAGMASGSRSYGNLKNRHAWAPHSGFAPPHSGLRRPLVPISAHSRSHFRSYYGATTPIGPLSNARDSLNCSRSLPAHPTSRRILSQRRSVQPQENVDLPVAVSTLDPVLARSSVSSMILLPNRDSLEKHYYLNHLDRGYLIAQGTRPFAPFPMPHYLCLRLLRNGCSIVLTMACSRDRRTGVVLGLLVATSY